MLKLRDITNHQYAELMKYATKKCDAFCLVFISAFPYKLPPKYGNTELSGKLEPYLLHQTNKAKEWPGTPRTNLKQYVLNVYKCCKGTRQILSSIDWADYIKDGNSCVQDLCFLINHRPWFTSVDHEDLYFIDNETAEDMKFFKANGFHFFQMYEGPTTDGLRVKY